MVKNLNCLLIFSVYIWKTGVRVPSGGLVWRSTRPHYKEPSHTNTMESCSGVEVGHWAAFESKGMLNLSNAAQPHPLDEFNRVHQLNLRPRDTSKIVCASFWFSLYKNMLRTHFWGMGYAPHRKGPQDLFSTQMFFKIAETVFLYKIKYWFLFFLPK